MARRYRTNRGRVELPDNLDDKIGMLMNILDASAQTAITFLINKTIDTAIESLRVWENKATPEVKKIFSSVLKKHYEITKRNGKTVVRQIKKVV
jgi:hypothetical protein